MTDDFPGNTADVALLVGMVELCVKATEYDKSSAIIAGVFFNKIRQDTAEKNLT